MSKDYWPMAETELKHVRGHLEDAKKSNDPSVKHLAAVCEYLLYHLEHSTNLRRE